MRSTLATSLEVAGMVLATAGAYIAAPAAGFVVGGVCAFALGYQLEAD
jgi:hypothetical protein